MTGYPGGKVRGKRIFAAADEVPATLSPPPGRCKNPRKFMRMGAEAGSFLKKAF
jgi:hypothetical protein